LAASAFLLSFRVSSGPRTPSITVPGTDRSSPHRCFDAASCPKPMAYSVVHAHAPYMNVSRRPASGQDRFGLEDTPGIRGGASSPRSPRPNAGLGGRHDGSGRQHPKHRQIPAPIGGGLSKPDRTVLWLPSCWRTRFGMPICGWIGEERQRPDRGCEQPGAPGSRSASPCAGRISEVVRCRLSLRGNMVCSQSEIRLAGEADCDRIGTCGHRRCRACQAA